MIEKQKQIWTSNINYKEFEGNNIQTILILHWWWGSSDSWKEVWEILFHNGFNVIIPDLPGFWKTKLNRIFTLDEFATLIESFIWELWLKDIILWWHSNGGAISIKLVNKSKINIKRLILNNSAWIRNDKKRSIKRKILSSIIKPFKILKDFPWMSKFRNIFYKLIWNQDYLNTEKNPKLKQTYLNIINSDLKNEIKNINIDTLLIWWEKDTYTPLSDGYFMRKNIKNSKMCILDNETHGIHLKNPKRLTETFFENI